MDPQLSAVCEASTENIWPHSLYLRQINNLKLRTMVLILLVSSNTIPVATLLS